MGVLSMLNDAKIPFPINCVDNELLLDFLNVSYLNKAMLDTLFFENIVKMIYTFNTVLGVMLIFTVCLLLLVNFKNLINIKIRNFWLIILYFGVMPLIGLSYFSFTLFLQFIRVNDLNRELIDHLKSWCMDSGVEYGIDLFHPESGEHPYLIFLTDWAGAPYIMYTPNLGYTYTQIILVSIGIILVGVGLFYLTGGLGSVSMVTKSLASSNLAVISKSTALIKTVTVSKSIAMAKGILAKTKVSTTTLLPSFTKLGVFVTGSGGNSPIERAVTMDVNAFLWANREAFFKLALEASNYYPL